VSGPELFAACLPFVLAFVYLAMTAAAWRALRRWGTLWALLLLLPAALVCSVMGSGVADELMASRRAEQGDGGIAGTFVATQVKVDGKKQTWTGTFSSDEQFREGVRLDNPPADMRPGTDVPARDTGAAFVVYGYGPAGAYQSRLVDATFYAVVWLAPGVWLAITLLCRGRAEPAPQGGDDDDDEDWAEPDLDLPDLDDDDE
jgi:hypothetical protein